MKKLLDRFLQYVEFDTQSDEGSDTVPSTHKQVEFARMLSMELKSLGLLNISLDENGFLMAGLPSNSSTKQPVIGLIAHMDTSPDFTAENIKPRIHENYDGKDLRLNENTVLSPREFPELKNYTGQTLITTDGNTLLGADDKAGIAIILTALEYLLENQEIKHGEIRIAFTPDEEIGRGADHFDVKKFGADFAYTMDGGEIGELEYESFNAALATVKISGRNVHPGTAKGKMINSLHLIQELNARLPENERPEKTEDYEGFFHLIDMKGTVEKSEMRYLVRDHSRDKFKWRKNLLHEAARFIQEKYPGCTVDLNIRDQYYNMKEKIVPVFHIVDRARIAMLNAGVQPIIKPIRGGTDGSRLSFMGLPTPNIFTGGHNFHGRYEYIPLQSMVKAVEVVIGILRAEK